MELEKVENPETPGYKEKMERWMSHKCIDDNQHNIL